MPIQHERYWKWSQVDFSGGSLRVECMYKEWSSIEHNWHEFRNWPVEQLPRFLLFSEYYKILNCLQTCVNFLNRKEFGQAVILL